VIVPITEFPTTADQLEQEVLKLPAEQRVRRAECILASLDDGTEIEPALLREVRRRVRDLGAATLTSPPTLRYGLQSIATAQQGNRARPR
jgi:hypothetical protein